MKTFNLRIAQIDLARQMETIDYIKSFIDMIKDNGYNSLFLYLEDRIITPSYQLPKANEAYTCEEIKELVAYGKTKDVELFPCVSTIGHAERFLRHPEFEKYAELRGNMVGTFGGTAKNDFCLSSQAFYDFLFKYIKEVTELFDSEYFHIGLDEFWDFGICEECKKKASDYQGKQKVFVEHICKVNNFLKSIGKKSMMWTDMLENFPNSLELIPKDIILVDWQYQRDVRFNQGHFCNIKKDYSLNKYLSLGFEVIIAPADYFISNIETYIKYAQNYQNIIGCMVTSWEKTTIYLERVWPKFAFAGYLMNGECRELAINKTIEYFFGKQDQIFNITMENAMQIDLYRHYSSISNTVLFNCSYFGINFSNFLNDEMTLIILQNYRNKILNPKGIEVLDDIILALKEKSLSHELKKLFMDSLNYGYNESIGKEIDNKIKDFIAKVEFSEKLWETKRANITPNMITQKLPYIKEQLETAHKKLKNDLFLKINFVLPDEYGACNTRIFGFINNEYKELANGVYKSDNVEDAMFKVNIPIEFIPEKIKVEVTGFGGIGISCIEIKKGGKTIKTATKIGGSQGIISNLEYILTCDSTFCYIGEMSVQKAFIQREISKEINSIELILGEITNG